MYFVCFFCICILGFPNYFEAEKCLWSTAKILMWCKKLFPDFMIKFELKIDLRIEDRIAHWGNDSSLEPLSCKIYTQWFTFLQVVRKYQDTITKNYVGPARPLFSEHGNKLHFVFRCVHHPFMSGNLAIKVFVSFNI